MGIFWNPDERRLRVLWRLAAQTALMVALGLLPIVGIAEPLTRLHRRGLFLPGYSHEAYDRVVNMIVGPFLVAAVIAQRRDGRALARSASVRGLRESRSTGPGFAGSGWGSASAPC